MYRFFCSLITFIIALLCILVGVVGLIVPWSLDVREYLTRLLVEDSLVISLFGFTLVVIGVATAAYIIMNSRSRYYYIKTGNGTVLVDEGIVQEYLIQYWKQLMPDANVTSSVHLKDNKISIHVDFPSVPLSGQRPLLEKVKTDLRDWLFKILGYHQEFGLHATFQR